MIATTRNARHAQSLARELMLAAKVAGGAFRRISGLDTESGWVLLDLDLVVVHLFDRQTREFYALESLWNDVPKLPFEPRQDPAVSQNTAPLDTEERGPGAVPSNWPHSVGDL